MRVLVLTPVYPHEKSPTEGLFNEQHAMALQRQGVDVTVVVCKQWLPDKLARVWMRYTPLAGLQRNENRNGIQISFSRYLHIPKYRLPWLTVTSCAGSILRTTARLGAARPFDIIQVHSAWPVGLAAPLVAEYLDCLFVVTLHIQDDPRLLEGKTGKKLYHRMLTHAGALVVVGRPLASFLQRFLPGEIQDKVRIIANGVDLQTASIVRESIQPEGAQEGRIVSVGNLWRTKGIDDNLRALAQVQRDGISWRQYTIVGDGPELRDLKRLACDLGIAGKVRFAGSLPHSEALMEIARADVFSLPSWMEAFGVVYLEAMALGKPVIGCRGQGAEDIIQDGVNGFLVNPKDPDDLAQKLALMLSRPDLAKRLGEAGRVKAERFTWESNAFRYIELYQSVLARRQAQAP